MLTKKQNKEKIYKNSKYIEMCIKIYIIYIYILYMYIYIYIYIYKHKNIQIYRNIHRKYLHGNTKGI